MLEDGDQMGDHGMGEWYLLTSGGRVQTPQ